MGLLQQRLTSRPGEPGIIDLFIDGGAPELEGFDLPVQLCQLLFVLLGTGCFLGQAAADLLPGLFQSGNVLRCLGGSSLIASVCSSP